MTGRPKKAVKLQVKLVRLWYENKHAATAQKIESVRDIKLAHIVQPMRMDSQQATVEILLLLWR